MVTVFDMAVHSLTREAFTLARDNEHFRTATYAEFQIALWKQDRSMFGLPPEVFMRAMKEAHQRMLKHYGTTIVSDPPKRDEPKR